MKTWLVTRCKEYWASPHLLVGCWLRTLKCHITDSIKKELAQAKIDPVIVPGGCTEYIQAPDVAWNKPFKAKVTEKYDAWMADGAHSFTAAGNMRGPPRPGNRQVGSWGLGNSRQRVNYPFFQKLRAYCGSWRIWRWSDSLSKGGSTLSYRTRSPGIHLASPNSFLRDWPICWCYVVGCRGGSTRKFTYWAEWQWHWSWLRIMKQRVASPGHKPNNEQLQFICFNILSCFVLIYCFVTK